LQREIYAIAALVGASLEVLGQKLSWQIAATPWFAAGVCFAIRMLAVHYSWSLPIARGAPHQDRRDDRSEGERHG